MSAATVIRAALLCTLASLAVGCDGEDGPFATAYIATSPNQLIGGDVAMARVGDFILENDKIRIAILNKDSSPAPGVFGGTFVDADLQRREDRFRNGNGRDQLAEVIPVANLLWTRPGAGDVTIVSDGADGGSAIVRVTGDGEVFLEALSVLRGSLVGSVFQGTKFDITITTDYVLEPGASDVRMIGRVTVAGADESGAALALPVFDGPVAIFPAVLGDAATGIKPGVIGGDFVFFGAQNDIFAPQMGFDEEKTVFDALFEGADTFTTPLAFDYMAASGGAVSYGYFSVDGTGQTDPKVLVPIITSSSTAFVTHGINCLSSESDDATCDAFDVFTWERYLAIGQGDIASVADIVHARRGTPVGTLRGVVRGTNGQPLPNGKVFVLADPDSAVTFTDVADIAEANMRVTNAPGILNAIDADVGLDRVEDGVFKATMPAGTYLIVAQNAAQTSTSAPLRVTLEAGKTVVVAPAVPPPGRVRYRIKDAQGQAIEAKLSFVSVLADGSLADLDGLRRPYLGEGRLGNGVRYMVPATDLSAGGEGLTEVEAGAYEVVVSHGPEFSITRTRINVAAGQEVRLEAVLIREVDTRGWISGDFHLHAEASFDSGMKFTERVRRALIEGVDLAVATDHDIVTDYGPAVRELGVEGRIQTGVGVEMSTLELGHFIAFPLNYEQATVPDHGAPDWQCLDGPLLLDELNSKVASGQGGVNIVAHPRDGFIGHISQIGLDPYDFSRQLSFLEENNVLLARSTCDFDAMELFNGKRFDLVRTPTNREVILYNRCSGRLDAAEDRAALDAACPEVSEGGPLATCDAGLRFFECKQRHRRRLAFLMARQILERTPEEQLAVWEYTPDGQGERHCDPEESPEAIDPAIADQPCVIHAGTYDDWMKWLDVGLNITITGASDSHGSAREPGMPRTFVAHAADTPGDIDVGHVAEAVVAHKALATFGPFVEVSVGGAGMGDTAVVSGESFALDLRVQTASWFGVDRIEVYVSGRLEEVITLDHATETIVDYDGTLTLPVPDADGFVSVVAMGLEERNLLGPVALDVTFGELQLPRVAALAFGSIQLISFLFEAEPVVPDFFPVFPIAATNAILLDVDGNGWAPAGPLPSFCAPSCNPTAADPDSQCPANLACLSTGECGLEVEGACVTGPPGTEDRVVFPAPE
ncbi:MAG: hypothetical protein ACI9MR_001774 [Myxococcota bacterium]